jgi:histidinol-phosphate/aromatic aminotransferase/cobyric acid decarboxylase-like protein
VLSLNVMSKAYGLPGLRIGWLACRDRALLERLEHYISIPKVDHHQVGIPREITRLPPYLGHLLGQLLAAHYRVAGR